MIIDAIQNSNLSKQCVIASLSILLITGCSISVPQAESSYRFLSDLILSDDLSMREQQPIWLASVGDRGAVLRPYFSGGLTIFANVDGDAIAFDGWTVRSVLGFGLEGPLSIKGKDGVRTFTVGGQKMETKCDDWSFADLIWSQICSNGPSKILLDDEGNIQEITMPIGDGLHILVLRVAK